MRVLYDNPMTEKFSFSDEDLSLLRRASAFAKQDPFCVFDTVTVLVQCRNPEDVEDRLKLYFMEKYDMQRCPCDFKVEGNSVVNVLYPEPIVKLELRCEAEEDGWEEQYGPQIEAHRERFTAEIKEAVKYILGKEQ